MPDTIELAQQGEVDISTVRMTDSSRMPKFALTMAWWALCSAMVYLIIGATLALYYGTTNALIGMLMSVIVYSAVNYVLTNHAIRTGLSVSLFSRVLFGSAGAALATLIFAATVIYYTVFESSVIAVALNTLFPSVSYPLACLIVVAYSVPLVFGSVQNWLDKLNGVLLPFYAVGLIAAVAIATTAHGYSPAWMHFGESPTGPAASNGWWNCFVYYMGVWLFMLAAFDFARFGKKEHARYHSLINFGMPFWIVTFVVNGVVGIYLVSTMQGQSTLSEVSVVLALLKLMGLWGFGFLVVTQTRINTANYYLATINTQALFEAGLGLKLPKFVWTIVVGAIVYALMLSGIFSKLLLALAYQGVFVVAWVAVALAHILSHKSERTSDDAVEGALRDAPTFNVGGLVAWFAGVAAGIGLMSGPESIHSFSAPATFVISVAAYLTVSAYAKRSIPVGT
ncbi:allantoin permease [Paraburkholderia sp. MMS20-SJTR3]|uniref:Allantoin permease n=1 Tax=Paraburkholderia sejongensis TaxID=2886946 RepID=A0ABS8JSJ6_9BURK|nr:allantoin permease [Paraburkholderia sp. MMS20-SJTR3]MCC8392875.1 allantoin permease [Paraburkholderia sp. MMS20-SJTR3]